MCVLSHFSCVRLFVTLWITACQTPLSMGFSRQEYWSGLQFPAPGDLPNPGIEPCVSCIGRKTLYHWAAWETALPFLFLYALTAFSKWFQSFYLDIYSATRYKFYWLDVSRSTACHPEHHLPQCQLNENMNEKCFTHTNSSQTDQEKWLTALWTRSFCSGWWEVLGVDGDNVSTPLCM